MRIPESCTALLNNYLLGEELFPGARRKVCLYDARVVGTFIAKTVLPVSRADFKWNQADLQKRIAQFAALNDDRLLVPERCEIINRIEKNGNGGNLNLDIGDLIVVFDTEQFQMLDAKNLVSQLVMASPNRIPLDIGLEIAERLADIIDFLHEKQLVHGCITAENLFFSELGPNKLKVTLDGIPVPDGILDTGGMIETDSQENVYDLSGGKNMKPEFDRLGFISVLLHSCCITEREFSLGELRHSSPYDLKKRFSSFSNGQCQVLSKALSPGCKLSCREIVEQLRGSTGGEIAPESKGFFGKLFKK